MAIDFPSNPSNGQQILAGGNAWQYSSAKSVWEKILTSGKIGGFITTYTNTSDLPLSNVAAGTQAFVTSSNALYISNGSGWYSIALVNTNPNITSVQDASSNTTPFTLATDGSATVITITASDPEGFPLTYGYSVTSGSLTNGGGTTATVTQADNVFTVTPTTNASYAGDFTLTFTVSDGINTSTSVNVFSLAFSVQNSRYTTLLATAVDTSDNSITDSSTNNYTITTVGGTTHAGTFSPYRPGGYSTYFDGTGDYITTTSTDYDLGTSSAFTVEFWYYFDESRTHTVFDFYDISSVQNAKLVFTSTNVYLYDGVSNILALTRTQTVGAWEHFCWTRDASNNHTFYINGSQVGTSTAATSIDAYTIDLGRRAGNFNSTFMKGYISDFRIVKGTAITPASGGPTERLTAVTNTSLLTCHLPYIADGSSSAHAVTISGNTSTKPFGLYDYDEYSGGAGGSVSMPNDNDYLYVPHSSTLKPSGTDPFCVSFWYYPTTSPGTTRQLVGDFQVVSYPTNCPGWDILYQSGSQLDIRWGYPNYADLASGKTNSTVQVNAWNHIVFCRSGGSLSYYLNGKRCNTTTSNINISASGLANFYVGYAGEASGSAMNTAMGTIADFKYEVGTSQFDATASTITIPTAPQSTTNSVLHIKGSDISFVDRSQSANIALIGPGTGTSTESPFAGGKSLDLTSATETYAYVDGDSIVVNANEAYTFEFWMKYVGQRGATGTSIFDWGIHSGNGNVALFRQNTGGYKLHITGFGGFSSYSTAYDSLEDGTWKHFALSRTSSGDVKSFIDGSVIESSTGYTLSVADTVKKLRIGGLQNYNGYGIKMYIQDVRLTKGLARYTANFTPPTQSLKG